MPDWTGLEGQSPIVYGLLTLHFIIGGLATGVATRKGYRRDRWLVIGLIGGTPALIAALLLPQLETTP